MIINDSLFCFKSRFSRNTCQFAIGKLLFKLRTASATTPATIIPTTTVPIKNPPFRLSAKSLFCPGCLYGYVQSLTLFIRTSQQVNECYNNCDRHNRPDTESGSCEQSADLIYNQRYQICKTALISDCCPEPFCIVHFTFDRTHSCEARCTQQVECQEGISAYCCESCSHGCVNACVSASVKESVAALR